MSHSHDCKTVAKEHGSINLPILIKKEKMHEAGFFFKQLCNTLLIEGILLNSVLKKFNEKEIQTFLEKQYLPRIKTLLTKDIQKLNHFCRGKIQINSLISALTEQCFKLITLNIMEIDLDSLINTITQEAIKNKEVNPLIRFFEHYHTQSLKLFPTIKETSWKNLATESKKHVSLNEKLSGGYLDNQEIIRLAALPTISLGLSYYILTKSSLDETPYTTMKWLSNLKFLLFMLLLCSYLIIGRNYNKQKKLDIYVPIKPQTILNNTCHQYIRTCRNHSEAEYALLDFLGISEQPTSLIQSSEDTIEKAKTDKPLKRWQKTSETTPENSAPTALIDSKKPERRVIEDKKHDLLYYEFKKGVFCKHDNSHVTAWGKRLGHGDGTSFAQNIKETYERNNFFRPAGSNGPGINLVAAGEKRKFKFDLKLKLDHTFHHLRVGANKRRPNAYEKGILGQDSEVYSPKGIQNK